MCLYDKKRFRFTFKRIPVYKIVIAHSDGKLYSPYIGVPITRVMKPNKRWLPEKNDFTDDYEFEGGFIHACLSESSAKKFIQNNFLSKHNIRIIEGYIPAFTRYAIDQSDFTICARRMILDI